MDGSRDPLHGRAMRAFERLLSLYPPGFKREFAAEIYAVFAQRMVEVGANCRPACYAFTLREMMGLARSILKERWHEWWVQRSEKMASEDQISPGTGSGGFVLQTAGVPGSGLLWVAGWTLLTTLVFPLALFLASPLAILYLWLVNLGVKAGFWPAAYTTSVEMPGIVTGIALGMAGAQWLMLRKILPRPGTWCAATAAGIWIAGLAAWGYLLGKIITAAAVLWVLAAIMLVTGLSLGLAQWLSARRFLPNAQWIILIDLLACGSLLLFPPVISSYTVLAALLVLTLPGIITGMGMLLLLKQSKIKFLPEARTRSVAPRHWLRRLAWTGGVLVVLVPLFFVSIYVYATAQITLARNQGVYPTVEAAVIATNSHGYAGAQFVSVENIHTGPNYADGRQPFIWFGTATIKLDRIPPGHTRAEIGSGSYYVHVHDGWVFMSEGAFPEFVGWVMELYHLEGVP